MDTENLPVHVFGEIAGQEDDDGSDVLGLELGGHGLDIVGHARLGHGRNGVDGDSILREFERPYPREAGDAGFGGAVVRLAEVPHEAGVGGGIDDPARDVVVFHVPGGGATAIKRSVEMDGDHRPPFVVFHLGERLVAEDARIVHEDVEATEVLERGLHDPLGAFGVGYGVGVRHGRPARLADLRDHGLRHRGAAAAAVPRDADVVDHELRPFGRQGQGMSPAQPSAGSGDDRDFSFEELHL